MDNPGATNALSRYSVRATPTTIITDPEGNILKQVEGGIGKPEFLELIGKLN
jgi:thioredoxin-related protein